MGEGAFEEEDVGFGGVVGVMDPARTHRHPDTPPLVFGQEFLSGHFGCHCLGQNHMSILVLIVVVLLRVVNFRRHLTPINRSPSHSEKN